MGSGNSRDFYTFAEAAAKIGRSSRTVQKYVAQGVLRTRRESRKVLLLGEDVESLAVDLGANLPPMNREGFYQLAARVERLERDMTVLRRMNDIRGDPLRPSHALAAELHLAAEKALAAQRWSVEEIDRWSDVFDRLDEIALTKISEAVNIRAPWEPFFRLCLAQMSAVSSAENFATSLRLQTLHQRLDQGRKTIRGTIITWAELGRGDLPNVVVDTLDGAEASVTRRLAANGPGRSG